MCADEYTQLKRFVAKLGWGKLERYEHAIPSGICGKDVKQSIVWYESGSPDDVVLQINRAPSFHAGVFAIRYRLCSGWYRFSLFSDDEQQSLEAERVSGWLARAWFITRASRREYRLLYPECAGYSYKRLAEEGPPYEYQPDPA
jgi:hypothetical protein